MSTAKTQSKPAKPRAARKKTCPECGSAEVAPIIYGYPADTDAALKAADAGQISLGGCVIYDDSPAWNCRACHHEWGRLA